MSAEKSLRKEKRVLCLGEVLWDGIHGMYYPGGAPANVSYHLSVHGLDVSLASAVGSDADGDALVHELQQRGLNTSLLQRNALPTLKTNAISDVPKLGPSLKEGVSFGEILLDDELLKKAREADLIYLGTAIQHYPRSLETISALVQSRSLHSSILFSDLNLRWQRYTPLSIQRTLEWSDMLKLTVKEAEIVARLLGVPGNSPERFLKELCSRFSIELTLLTDGVSGSYLLTAGGKTQHIPAFRVEEPSSSVDTLGAGDAYVAGFLTTFLREYPHAELREAAEYGSKLSSFTAHARGAMPEYDLERLTTWLESEST